MIKSPGIPDRYHLIRELKEKGIPVISEIEFAARYTTAKLICITGSNGKTTTTLLTHHILKQAGLDVAVAGNMGNSFAMELARQDHDYFVLEISSFQLDGMFDFKADIAILLNITPDHLDRYGNSFEEYAGIEIQDHTGTWAKKDAFIYCQDDPVIMENDQKCAALLPANIPLHFKFKCRSVTEHIIKDNNIIINIQSNTHGNDIRKLSITRKAQYL